MQILENFSLREHNTFNVDSMSKYYVEIEKVNDIHTLIDSTLLKDNKYYILGAGSNTLFAGDYDGAVIKISLKGMNYTKISDEYNIVEVAAGENWHNFVTLMNRNGLYGLENLAFIPGEVGGAPIQNIGAYGVEQKDFFDSLTAINLETNQEHIFNYDDCNFDYRDSVFKNKFKNKYIITSVRYKLKKQPVLNYQYSSLSNEIKKFSIENPDTQYIFDTIIRLRRERLPDYHKLGNAGSFFKNPILTWEETEQLLEKFPGLPVFRESESLKKIPAAYLIEKAGWKGKRLGNVGVYENHALILVNYGNAKGKEILDLANNIIADVYNRFQVTLEPEVVILN
jgi:UDP-N-acetylmuramate dehydrogenase